MNYSITNRSYVRSRHESGAVLPFVAIVLLSFIGVFALMLNFGRMLLFQERLKIATEAAAFSSIKMLDKQSTDFSEIAKDVAAINLDGILGSDTVELASIKPSMNPKDFTFGVSVSGTSGTWFSQLMGASSSNMNASSSIFVSPIF
jgi:Flp pilus assembly protein TadG